MKWITFIILLAAAFNTASDETRLPAPKNGGVYVIAHRGAHDQIPENTLAAYQKAIEIGADFVEVDLRTTKDNQIVSIHNGTVDNYTKDAKGPVRRFTLAELKAMDIGSRIGTEWRNERIPEFEEILSLCKGKIALYIDLKDASIERVMPILRKYDMQKNVVWYAGFGPLKIIQKECPECLLMPDPGVEALLTKTLDQWNPKVVATSWGSCSEQFFKIAHARGAKVFMDEDGKQCWEQALEWGVDGIQTNDPADLIAVLKKRAEQLEKAGGAK